MKFTKAFADARKSGQETFRWNGKLYNTKLAKTTPENTTAVKQLQTILQNEGLYKGKIDGIFGPLSEAAYNSYTKPVSISNLPSWIVGGKGKETSTPVVTPPPKKTPTPFPTPPKVTPTPSPTPKTTEKPKVVKKSENPDSQWKYYPKGTWNLGDMDGLDVDGKSYRLVGPTTFNRTGYDAAESRFYVKEDDQVYAQRGAKESFNKIQDELKDAEIRVKFPGYLAKGRETAEMQFKRPGDDRWHAMDSTIVARGEGVWSNYDNQGNYNPWTSWRQKEILNMPTTKGYKYAQTPYEFRSNPYKYGGVFKEGGPLKDQPAPPVLDISRWQLGKQMYDAMPQWKKDAEARDPENVGYMSMNPKNWKLNDYSKYSSFNSAFRNARSKGESEFMYKDKRYNTNLIPKEQSDEYHDSKAFLDEYYRTQNIKPAIDTFTMAENFQKEKYGITQSEIDIDSLGVDEYIKRHNEIRERGPEFLKYMEKHRNDEELANLHNKDYYFSITNQNAKDVDYVGYHNRGSKKLFVTSNPKDNASVNTTYVHELSHKSDDKMNLWTNPRMPDIDTEKYKKYGYPREKNGMPWDSEFWNYVVKDTETEARKMSALYYLKKNNRGYKSGEVSWDDMAFLVDSPDVPSDVRQLTEVYKHQLDDLLKYLNNDFYYGDTQQPQMTKEIKPIEKPTHKPIKKPKFQYGGVYNPYTTKRNFRGPDQMRLPEHNLGGLLGTLGKSLFGTTQAATNTLGAASGLSGFLQGNPEKANIGLGTFKGALSGAATGMALGPIGAGVGALIGGVSSFIGGQKRKKQMAEEAALMEQQRIDNMPDTVNQFGTFKFGGNMFSPDLLKGASIQYNGPSHANGGTMVNNVGLPTTDPSKAVGEVEKKERMFTMPGGTKYIFSDHLTF